MPATRRTKKAAPAPYSKAKKETNPLFKSTPKNFRIGGDVQPVRDLSRYVKWPRYVRIQRQRKILNQRLKVPPAINQFTKTLDKNAAAELFRFLVNYRPETKQAKSQRLQEMAESKADGKDVAQKKPPPVLKFGLKHVTTLVEQKKAKFVVIAHDVDPIELVVWLPALCKKMDVPYCIVKGKARVGTLVHQKTATCVALTAVNKEDNHKMETFAKSFRTQYNENPEACKRWGGGVNGMKSIHVVKKAEKLAQVEAEKKLNL